MVYAIVIYRHPVVVIRNVCPSNEDLAMGRDTMRCWYGAKPSFPEGTFAKHMHMLLSGTLIYSSSISESVASSRLLALIWLRRLQTCIHKQSVVTTLDIQGYCISLRHNRNEMIDIEQIGLNNYLLTDLVDNPIPLTDSVYSPCPTSDFRLRYVPNWLLQLLFVVNNT